MFTILMEQPLLILVTGLLLTGMCTAGFLKTGKRSLLLAASGLLILTLGLLALERTTATPREQVKATLHVIASDLERNDVTAVVNHISRHRGQLIREAKQKMAMVEILKVDIKRNLKIEIHETRGTEIAEARFNAVIRLRLLRGLSDEMRPAPRFFVVRFRKEQGQWRIRDYEMHDPRQGIGR